MLVPLAEGVNIQLFPPRFHSPHRFYRAAPVLNVQVASCRRGCKKLHCEQYGMNMRLGSTTPKLNHSLSRRLAWTSRRVYEAASARVRSGMGGHLAGLCPPVSIAVLLTERCNARCVHCDIWKNKGRESSPTVEQWKRFIDDIAGWFGPASLITFTGGEALLQVFTPELIEYSVAAGVLTEMLTHGYWTDHSRLERVARANPWRLTMSLDGIGATHSIVRGRENFWDLSYASLMTLKRLRIEESLDYTVRLKTVIMDQNIDGLADVARFALDHGFEVFYQPIEQNYNTAEDPDWYLKSANWPRDPQRAIRALEELIRLRESGYPIANKVDELRIMTEYFSDPARLQVRVREHTQGERRAACTALSMLQVQSNGDVVVCVSAPPVGNIKDTPIRDIWRSRPQWWKSGCCLDWRCSAEEKRDASLVTIQ